MKVLFTLLFGDGLTHLNPLISLRFQCQKQNIENAFPIPKFRHDFLRQYSLNVLDFDRQPPERMDLRTEIMTYGKYKPAGILRRREIFTKSGRRCEFL